MELMPQSLFLDVKLDPAQLSRLQAQPLPRDVFVMYFTARSGSTRLSELFLATGGMGRATEFFNPSLMQKMVNGLQAQDMETYIEHGKRWLKVDNVFSIKVTAGHIGAAFDQPADFFDVFSTVPSIWVTREDIVAQGVSLAKMVTTKIGHSPHATADEITSADQTFGYDPNLIRRWILHILDHELTTERYFAKYNINPLRVTYEQINQMTPEEIVVYLNRFLFNRKPHSKPAELTHKKLGTSRNQEFAQRFREENSAFLQDVERVRAGRIGRLLKMLIWTKLRTALFYK